MCNCEHIRGTESSERSTMRRSLQTSTSSNVVRAWKLAKCSMAKVRVAACARTDRDWCRHLSFDHFEGGLNPIKQTKSCG